LLNWERNSLEGGNRPQCFETRKELSARRVYNTCGPKERVRSKVTPRNFGAGLKESGVPQPVRAEVVVRHGRVQAEEETFIFSRLNEIRHLKPFFRSVKGFLEKICAAF